MGLQDSSDPQRGPWDKKMLRTPALERMLGNTSFRRNPRKITVANVRILDWFLEIPCRGKFDSLVTCFTGKLPERPHK